MTPLAVEIQRILESERSFPPLSVESLCRVLYATGAAGGPVEPADVEAALAELMHDGSVERVFSPRIGPRFKATPHPAAVVAEAGNRI